MGSITSSPPHATQIGERHNRSIPLELLQQPQPLPLAEAKQFCKQPDELPPELQKEEELFTFEDVKRIDLLEEKTQETLLVLKLNLDVLELNLDVLEDWRTQYEAVTNDSAFPEDLRRGCKMGISRFMRGIRKVQMEFQKQLNRAQNLLVLLEHRKNLLYFLIQYPNMRQSRKSAMEMENLTKNVERIANKTQQEAISMRITTLVTLFFLPATSIATFFGAGIVKFKEEDDTWSIGKRSLGLYLGICIFLTVVTFLTWWAMMGGISRLRSKWQGLLRTPWNKKHVKSHLKDGQKDIEV